MATSFSQCHINPVLVPPCKPHDPVKYLYENQTYDMKTWVYIWTSMDVVPVEYVHICSDISLEGVVL